MTRCRKTAKVWQCTDQHIFGARDVHPMAHHDSRSMPASTGSEVAAERSREGVDLLLSAWPGAAEALGAATAVDPGFAPARALLDRRLHRRPSARDAGWHARLSA